MDNTLYDLRFEKQSVSDLEKKTGSESCRSQLFGRYLKDLAREDLQVQIKEDDQLG